MKDGSVLFVQIETKQISRLKPDGSVVLVAQLDGGPNGSAPIGPDKALYVANDGGGRFSFAKRGPFNFPGAAPADLRRRLDPAGFDMKTGKAVTLYDSCEGKRLRDPALGTIWSSTATAECGSATSSGKVRAATPASTTPRRTARRSSRCGAA